MSDLPSSPRRLRFWLVALLLFAATVRLVGLDFDDRHFFHPDERRIAFAVEELSFQPLQLNPHFFAYGSFPLYVTRAVTSALSLVDERMGHYDNVILIGRGVSAAIGVLTVMWITVAERTSEIGLLKAIGATPADILFIFLGEAMLLAGAGGLIGIMTGFGLARIVRLAFPGVPFAVSLPYVGAAFATSVLVGLVCGILPARRATRLDPVEALHAD